jgi:diguanylate cyclase (GGDEF)-like protein
MQFVVTPYVLIHSTAVFFALLVSALAWRRRDLPGGKALSLLMLAVGEWSLMTALEVGAVGVPAKIFWSKLQYLGLSVSVPLFIVFALSFTRNTRWLTRRNLIFLGIIPGINILIAATNEWHHLTWTGFIETNNGTNLLVYEHGAWFWFFMVFVNSSIIIASYLFVRGLLHPSRLHRHQAGILVLGTLPPWIGNALYVFDLNPVPGLDLSHIGFIGSGIVLLIGISGFRLLDLVPVAREWLIEHLGDGVLVIDEQNRIVDINPAARELLDVGRGAVGQPMERAFSRWPEVLELIDAGKDLRTELHYDQPDERVIDLRISSLSNRRGLMAGKLILLHDITHQNQTRSQLEQANVRLQAQITEIEGLHEQLREQAIRDPLTGLFNRRYLDETLPRELSRAGRENYPVTVIMLDVDSFKNVNDSFGHAAGDLMLRALGIILQEKTRRGDIACRYGGEEFVVVMPGLSLLQAKNRAEQIRAAFENRKVKWGKDRLRATISLGVATYPRHGKTEEEIMRSADFALYAAKAAGRNRVEAWQMDTQAGD